MSRTQTGLCKWRVEQRYLIIHLISWSVTLNFGNLMATAAHLPK